MKAHCNCSVQDCAFTAQSVRKRRTARSKPHRQRRFSWACGVTVHGPEQLQHSKVRIEIILT